MIRFSSRFRKEYKKVPRKIADKFDSRLSLFLRSKKSVLLRNHELKGRWMGV